MHAYSFIVMWQLVCVVTSERRKKAWGQASPEKDKSFHDSLVPTRRARQRVGLLSPYEDVINDGYRSSLPALVVEQQHLCSFMSSLDSYASSTPSLSPTARNSEYALRMILSRLGHLDLSGQLLDKEVARDAHGGYCDVFVGHLSPASLLNRRMIQRGGFKVKVAIKQLRVRLDKEMQVAKVRYRLQIETNDGLGSNITLDAGEGDDNMVDTRSP